MCTLVLLDRVHGSREMLMAGSCIVLVRAECIRNAVVHATQI